MVFRKFPPNCNVKGGTQKIMWYRKSWWLQIKPISTTAIDGHQILLDGGFSKEGEQRRGVALGLGIGLGLTYLPGFGFFFLMLKEEKIILPQGTMLYDIYIKENY